MSNEQKVQQIKKSERNTCIATVNFCNILENQEIWGGLIVKTKGFNSFLPVGRLPTENGAELSSNVDCCQEVAREPESTEIQGVRKGKERTEKGEEQKNRKY